MPLRPTVFVGLGTTGYEMLRAFRRFIFETYERANLPIFKLLVIETREEIIDDDPWFPNIAPADRIEIVPAVLRELTSSRERITPGHRTYDPHLAGWLPEEILGIQGNQFVNGASNIRAAGRLCLWMNWPAISEALDLACRSVIAKESIDGTVKILTNFYNQHDGPVPFPLTDDRGMVFVVGSLCGGTCSGMAIDVANYLRFVQRIPSIYGTFSTVDAKTPKGIGSDVQRRSEQANHVANTWAALTEFDFHLNTLTKDVPEARITPAGVFNGDDAPFDYIHIVSPGATEAVRFVDGNGEIELDQLNNMVALSLFMEAIGEVHDRKEAIRTDFRQRERFGRNNEHHHVQQLSSFGLAAILYPKTRIAAAAACGQAVRLCNSWLGDAEHADRGTIAAYAEEDWISDFAHIENSLIVDRYRKRNILDEVHALFRAQEGQFLAQDYADLGTMIAMFPNTERPLINRLDANGEYTSLIVNNVGNPFSLELSRCFIGDVESGFFGTVDRRLTRGDLSSMADASIYVEELIKHVTRRRDACPTHLPIFISSALHEVSNEAGNGNFWAAILGLDGRVNLDRKRAFVAKFERLIRLHVEQLRAFFMRQPLHDLVEALERRKREIDEFRSTLQRVRTKAESLARDLRSVPTWTNVLFVFTTESIDGDVRQAEGAVAGRLSEAVTALVPPDSGVLKFLRNDPEVVFGRMKEVFQGMVLSELNQSDATVLAGGQNNERLLSLFKRAIPFEEIDDRRRQGVEGLGMLEVVIGGGNFEQLDGFVKHLAELRLVRSNIRMVHARASDHLVVLYREQGALAIDDLAMAPYARDILAAKPGRYGHSNHRTEGFFDAARIVAEQEAGHVEQQYELERSTSIQTLADWLDGIALLQPELMKSAEGGGQSLFTFPDTSGLEVSYDIYSESATGRIVDEGNDDRAIEFIVQSLCDLRRTGEANGEDPLIRRANTALRQLRDDGAMESNVKEAEALVKRLLGELAKRCPASMTRAPIRERSAP